MTIFWDLASLAVVPMIAVPFATAALILPTQGFGTPSSLAAIFACVGMGLVQSVIFLSRRLPRSAVPPVFIRPAGAANCSLLNRGGSYEGRIGMPSGHAMTAAYLATLGAFLFLSSCERSGARTSSHLAAMTWSVAAAVTALVCASRVVRGCHNVPQVVVGTVLGIGAACAVFAAWRRVVASAASLPTETENIHNRESK